MSVDFFDFFWGAGGGNSHLCNVGRYITRTIVCCFDPEMKKSKRNIKQTRKQRSFTFQGLRADNNLFIRRRRAEVRLRKTLAPHTDSDLAPHTDSDLVKRKSNKKRVKLIIHLPGRRQGDRKGLQVLIIQVAGLFEDLLLCGALTKYSFTRNNGCID